MDVNELACAQFVVVWMELNGLAMNSGMGNGLGCVAGCSCNIECIAYNEIDDNGTVPAAFCALSR